MTVKKFIYAPEQWQQNLISCIDSSSAWSGKHSNFTPWVAQTYAELSHLGLEFKITENLAVDGIVLADRDTIGNSYRNLSQTILICAKSDKEFHPSAQFHVTHNRSDEYSLIGNKIWKSRYIPHWAIPGIKPRDINRGSKLENIAYIGSQCQLAEELQSPEWEKQVKELGLNWLPLFEPKLWNDYTNIDLIVAARKFPSPVYPEKGAIKLFNCWQAGVPALLAPESAFMAERSSNYDFLPINSIDEAYSQLKFLQANPEFYLQMLARCQEQRKTIERDMIREKWLNLFDEVEEFYLSWQQVPEWRKKADFLARISFLKQHRINYQMKKKLGMNV